MAIALIIWNVQTNSRIYLGIAKFNQEQKFTRTIAYWEVIYKFQTHC